MEDPAEGQRTTRKSRARKDTKLSKISNLWIQLPEATHSMS